jgi:hypothetical protein
MPRPTNSLATSHAKDPCSTKAAILHGRAAIRSAVQPTLAGEQLPAAGLAREPSPAERASDDGTDALAQRERHQLTLVVAAHE